MNPNTRPPWLLPVLIGVAVALVVIGAVALGLQLSHRGAHSTPASGASATTGVTVTVTESSAADEPETSAEPDSTDLPDRTDDSDEPSDDSPEGADESTPNIDVPPIARAAWYAQFGGFNDYDNAVSVRDEHYGALILPGEMVGSQSRYVVARPTRSRAEAQAVCDHFRSGECVVKQGVEGR